MHGHIYMLKMLNCKSEGLALGSSLMRSPKEAVHFPAVDLNSFPNYDVSINILDVDSILRIIFKTTKKVSFQAAGQMNSFLLNLHQRLSLGGSAKLLVVAGNGSGVSTTKHLQCCR